MLKKLPLVVLLMVAFSPTVSLACPSGQYEICALPRPFGGCAKNVCLPNGGNVVDGISDNLKDLNIGVIHLGNEVANVGSDVGRAVGALDSQVSIKKISKIDWGAGVAIASFLANGVACIASEGVSPGLPVNPQTSIACESNACTCSILSLYIAIKLRSDMSPEQKQKTEEISNDPKYSQLVLDPNIQAKLQASLKNANINYDDTDRKTAFPGPGRGRRILD